MWLTTLFVRIVAITQRRPSLADTVRRGLLDDLVVGQLSPGDKLPNEDRIGERFGVSRATVREAVLGLLEAGYLTRRHGSGTYVSKAPRSRHPLDATVDYTAMIRAAGHTPTEVLNQTHPPGDGARSSSTCTPTPSPSWNASATPTTARSSTPATAS